MEANASTMLFSSKKQTCLATPNYQAKKKIKKQSLFLTKAFKVRVFIQSLFQTFRSWLLMPQGLCKPLSRNTICLQDHPRLSGSSPSPTSLFYLWGIQSSDIIAIILIFLWSPPMYRNNKEFTLNTFLYKFGIPFTQH